MTPFHGAREVVALVAFWAALAMHAEAISSTFNAKLLEGSVLADATSHADPAVGFINVVLANPVATTLSARGALLTMRANLTATTLSAA